MSGVKRYTAYDALMQVESNGKFVLASDYDRDMQALKERLSDRALDQMRQLEELIECQTERDALRARVEAMRQALNHILAMQTRGFITLGDNATSILESLRRFT